MNSMSKTMATTIVGHNVDGVCSLSGRKGEVFLVRVGNGDVQAIQAGKLLEILRWNCAISTGEENGVVAAKSA